MTCLCRCEMTKEITATTIRYYCTNCGNYEIVEMNEVQKK